MGQILLAGKESYKRPALLGDVVADRPAEHGIPSLERVENRALCHRSLDLELNLALNVRQAFANETEAPRGSWQCLDLD